MQYLKINIVKQKSGISKFATLRPSQVLLNSQVPSNVCT